MGTRRLRRRSVDDDRISGLPDELLHAILVRLRCAKSAARTSVLSRRWRHVWAHQPELLFVAPRQTAPASFISAVDAALGGYLAPTLEFLGISHSHRRTHHHQGGPDRRIPAAGAGRLAFASWLQFAAEHAVGELDLYLFVPRLPVVPRLPGSVQLPESGDIGEEAVLELPAFERARRIELYLQYADADKTWLRPPASGQFMELTCLTIGGYANMDGSHLTALVSTQCPRLTDLDLCTRLVVSFDISMRSNSLHKLRLFILKTRRLEVVAPRLEELEICAQPMESHISAPKLVKVDWSGAYDPRLTRFVDVGRKLRILETSDRALSLTKRFDEVDELNMVIEAKFADVAAYRSFLNQTNKLPKCNSFFLRLFYRGHHTLVPIMLHLLRRCNSTKRFQVSLCGWPEPVQAEPLEESSKIDGIDLSSLEEVKISCFSGSHEQMELVEFICSNAGSLKKLAIYGKFCQRPKEEREKVHSMCHPNVRVKFYD